MISMNTMKTSAAFTLLALGLTACGPGPTDEPKTEATPPEPKTTAECPTTPPTPDATPGKLEPLVGKNVAKTCVVGVEGDALATAQKALVSKEGQALDPEKVRLDVGSLVKSGIIDNISISAIPAGKDVVLVYSLTQRPRIAEVTFQGAEVFEKEGLTKKVTVEKERPLVMSEVHDLVAAIKDEYGHRGYRSAKVDAKKEDAGKNLVRLKIVVDEGPQWKIGKITWKGVKKVPEAALRKFSELKEGEIFDNEKVAAAEMKASAVYFDNGMINAHVDHAAGEPDKDGKAALTFTVEEGEVFRIGKIKLAKLASADEKTLLPKLKSKPGQVFVRSRMVDDVKTITDDFTAKGQKVDVFPHTEIDPVKKTLDITIDVQAAAP